ncbi:hypothetical protein AAG570_005797 [Ranatra chinensis]|uniref:Uncharacterized protein n=1 Tax=Ranatra chinensis TaxID=642074 RepID=A0ABD0XYH4_9HEMI
MNHNKVRQKVLHNQIMAWHKQQQTNDTTLWSQDVKMFTRQDPSRQKAKDTPLANRYVPIAIIEQLKEMKVKDASQGQEKTKEVMFQRTRLSSRSTESYFGKGQQLNVGPSRRKGPGTRGQRPPDGRAIRCIYEATPPRSRQEKATQTPQKMIIEGIADILNLERGLRVKIELAGGQDRDDRGTTSDEVAEKLNDAIAEYERHKVRPKASGPVLQRLQTEESVTDRALGEHLEKVYEALFNRNIQSGTMKSANVLRSYLNTAGAFSKQKLQRRWAQVKVHKKQHGRMSDKKPSPLERLVAAIFGTDRYRVLPAEEFYAQVGKKPARVNGNPRKT